MWMKPVKPLNEMFVFALGSAKIKAGVLATAIALFGIKVSAHEVWIEPTNWTVAPSERLSAQLLNGQEFEGVKLSWNPRSIVRAELWNGDRMSELTGRLGDIPAFNVMSESEGLLTLVYQSTPRTITYTEFSKFEHFLNEKGFAAITQQHAERKLPVTPIKEAYSRFAKALVAAGKGAAADAPRGLELEIIALRNPYTAEPETSLRFEILYQGKALAQNLVTVFERDTEGGVTTFHRTTDVGGFVDFVAKPGAEYLIDTVLIREPDRALVAATRGAVWESLWASLTFKMPKVQ